MGKETPLQFIEGINPDKYHGYNLVLVDLVTGQMAYTANPLPNTQSSSATTTTSRQMSEIQPRGEEEREPLAVAKADFLGLNGDVRKILTYGPLPLEKSRFYGLSNGLLGEWSKVKLGLESLLQVLTCLPNQEAPSSVAGTASLFPRKGPTGLSKIAVAAATPTGPNPSRGGEGGGAGWGNQDDRQAAATDDDLPWEGLFDMVLGDQSKDKALMEASGGGGDNKSFEYLCSSRFIDPFDAGEEMGGLYGTRSCTILAVWADGRSDLRERTLVAEYAKQGSKQGGGGLPKSLKWVPYDHRFKIELGT